MNNLPEDAYGDLGVDRTATAGEIRKAFRSLAMKHHPDKGGNPEIFSKINNAWEILGDSEKREEYDSENGFVE